jgi:acid phosphatase
MNSNWNQIFKRAATRSLALLLLWGLTPAFHGRAQEKLVFAIDIIRHGDRTPLSNPFHENFTNLWPEGIGIMTTLGSNQEFSLGAEMKRRYYSGLLDAATASNSIRAFSTDTDRTRKSARYFLAGLVGDAAGSIPVNLRIPIDVTTGLSESNSVSAAAILNPDSTTNMRALQTQFVTQSPEWMATNAAWQPQFARWGLALGMRINNIQALSGLSDTWYIHQIHHVPWTNTLSAADIEDIIAAGRWAFVYEYNLNVGRVSGKPFVQKVSQYMENARREALSGQGAGLKYVLFSAHDSTLLSEMSALRSPLTGTNAPPYAAILHFGLFQSGGTNFLLRVNYKDRADHVVPDPENGGAAWSLEHLANLAAP